MRRIISYHITILVFLFLYGINDNYCYAQDPHFSQFYASPLYLAPSFAGAGDNVDRVALNYRNQYPWISSKSHSIYETFSFSFDHYFPKINSGAGILVMRDQAGSGNLGLTNIGGLYSYDFNITHEWHLRPGVHFLYTQRSLNPNKLTFLDEMIGTTTTGSSDIKNSIANAKGDLDFSTSVIGYNKQYWFGTTVDHLLTPNISLSGDDASVPVKVSVFGGAQLKLKSTLIRHMKESLIVAFKYTQQRKYKQVDLGAYYYKNPLLFGVWYRGIPFFKSKLTTEETAGLSTYANPGHDAIVFLMGYKLDQVSIGLSYDVTVSNLRTRFANAIEISMIYNFEIKPPPEKPTSLPCPVF